MKLSLSNQEIPLHFLSSSDTITSWLSYGKNLLVGNSKIGYLERIFESLDEPVLVKDKENAVEMPKISGGVKFQNVDFTYEEGVKVLDNINFECRPGDTVALVGPTGAGKTTVVNLL